MGRAKDFLFRIAETPSIEVFDRGGYTEEVWSVRSAQMRVIGNQITMAHGDAAGLYALLSALVKKLREQKPWKLKQLDQWLADAEGTRAMHQALARAIEKGEIEEGDSRGDWNEFYVTHPDLAEGKVKDFVRAAWHRHVAQTPDGKLQAAVQGYGFKRVAGRGPEDPREIWQLRRGSVTHTVQRGGPGTAWFYRRNTVPDYNFHAGPRSMLQALPRYLREGAAQDWALKWSPGPLPVVFGGVPHGDAWDYWSETAQSWGPRSKATVYDLRTFEGAFPPGTFYVERAGGNRYQIGITGTGEGDATRTPTDVRRIFDIFSRPHLRYEAEEQLGFDLPHVFKRGYAKRTVKALVAHLGHRGYKGVVMACGRAFRRLVGQYVAKAVYVWKEKNPAPESWVDARLVIELSIPQGNGAYTSRFVQQNWASFGVLCHALRTWRNLQGAPLYINGTPEGQIAYRNPRLVELGS